MNITSFIGLILGTGILYAALKDASPDLRMFLDYHAILIVIGGTFAAASISFPLSDIFNLIRVFFRRAGGRPNYQAIINELIDLNKKAAVSATALNDALPTIRNEFLREAVQLVAAGVLTEHELRETLEQRLKTVEFRYMAEANMFRTLGKFPPAFGLLATTLGMIGLLQQLGAPDSQKLIGPKMSIGLIGTLYGIALANLLFLPIAESLTIITQEELTLRRLIVEGAVMLKRHVNPVALRENLNSFLLPKERISKRAA